MGQKVHPLAFRLGFTTNWKSRWFDKKKYKKFLEQDVKLRDFILKKLSKASVEKVEIERLADTLTIIIRTARPGLIIGRGGSGIEDLKKELEKIIQPAYQTVAAKKDQKGKNNISKTGIRLEIEEVKSTEVRAALMAQNMADQIEKRLPTRRILKYSLDKLKQNKEVKGGKVLVKGRLNGSEIARKEWLKFGKLPLQTLRADIDYAQATAYTTYGTVGVKVWIYKGERFT